MFSECFAVLPAADIGRARAFYRDAFGFEPAEEHEGDLRYRPRSGISFQVYATPNAGSAKNTQMCLLTDDLDTDMRRLRERGVVFEEYDSPDLKTVDGVAVLDGERAAWLRDSEGNFICLAEVRT